MSAQKTTSLDHLRKLAARAQANAAAVEAKLKNTKTPEYSLVKQDTPEDGFLATYYLTKDGVQVGEKLNVPQDFLVQSATLNTVAFAGSPYAGAAVGEKYIRFMLNSKDAKFSGVILDESSGKLKRRNLEYILKSEVLEGFTMHLAGARLTVAFQEEDPTECLVWNDGEKKDGTVYAKSQRLTHSPGTVGSLAYGLTQVLNDKGFTGYGISVFNEEEITDRSQICIQVAEIKPGSGVGDPPEISIGDAVYVYLPVKDLVDVYTGGNGITVGSSSVVAAKIDAANANGLSATADGLKLGLATTTTAGAVSAADKAKMDGIGFATDAEVDAMLDEIFTTNA